MIKCEFCNKEYNSKRKIDSLRCLENHVKYCLLNPNRVGYKCKYCDYKDDTYNKLRGHIASCKHNPDYIEVVRYPKGVGRTHTDESRKKISESRKKYLLENPDKVPYLLNHSSKESYPEKYFTELFEKEDINVIKHYRIGLYELDFSIPNKLIDIEVDGNQHYTDPKIVESDIKRTSYLESNGWDVIRINWSEYSKMSFDDKSIYIDNIKKYINNLILTKPILNIVEKSKKPKILRIKTPKNRKNKKCKECGDKTSSIRCLKCYLLSRRVVERPPYDILIKEVKETNLSAVGRKYGVSGNAVKKWIKNY